MTTSQLLTHGENYEDENKDEEEKIETYKWYNVNVTMIPAKLSFLFENAKRIGYTSTLMLFLTGIGLNKAEAGFIVGFRLIGMIIGGPFWGMVADKKQGHKLIIYVMCICSIIFTCSQVFVSLPLADSNKNKCPVAATNVNKTMSQNLTLPEGDTGKESQNVRLMISMFVVNLVACFFEGSISSFIDTGVVRRCQLSVTRKVEYGKQRAYASIGAATGIVITNTMVDIFPTSDVTCYSGIFIAYFTFTLLELIVMQLLYRGMSFKSDGSNDHNTNGDRKMKKLLTSTLKQYDVVFFYLSVTVSGIIYAQYTSFTLIYLKELGAVSLLLSLSMVVSSLSGMISLYFAATIIRIVGGTWQAIGLGFFVYFVRYLIVSLIKNPWFILIAQPLHSVSSLLTVAASVTHIKSISPSGILATMCAIFNTLHYGLGNIIGSSIGGLIYQNFGGRVLYLSSAIIGLVWGIFLFIFLFIQKQRLEKRSDVTEEKVEMRTEL